MLYTFGDIVVVRGKDIGVILKCWGKPLNRQNGEPSYDIYIRLDNGIETFPESKVKRYLVRHKYLSKKEIESDETKNS